MKSLGHEGDSQTIDTYNCKNTFFNYLYFGPAPVVINPNMQGQGLAE